MKVSQLIKRLNSIYKKSGDLEFVICTAVDGRFCIEYNRDVDVIDLEGGESVCAVLNHDLEDVIEDPSEDPENAA